MKNLTRLAIGLATALLAGCSAGSQLSIGAASNVLETHAAGLSGRNHSWMARSAANGDLLYVVGGCGGTCVLSYPGGKLVGSLDEPQYGIMAICSDDAGNVFISDNSAVLEYQHGATNPIATLELPGDQAYGCSVDPTTGDLAVVFRGSGTDIAIFTGAQGQPALYNSQLDSQFCGYDGTGNLYVDGYKQQEPGLSMLPSGGSAFEQLSIGNSVGNPGQVQWDGKYITYQSDAKGNPIVSRLTIEGSSVTIAGTTRLNGIKKWPARSWIYRNRIVVPYSNGGARLRKLSAWNYPMGGAIEKQFRDFGSYKKALRFQGVTLSAATSI